MKSRREVAQGGKRRMEEDYAYYISVPFLAIKFYYLVLRKFQISGNQLNRNIKLPEI